VVETASVLGAEALGGFLASTLPLKNRAMSGEEVERESLWQSCRITTANHRKTAR
jgi:hypothetical protein